MPEIPDFLEESNTEDWEKIQRADYTDDNEKPPTPPAKDDLPAAYKKVESNTPPDDLQNWDMMESQIISPPINNENNAHGHDNNNNNTTNDNNDEYPEQLVDVDADVDADAHGDDEHVDQAGQVDLFSDAESVASAAPSEMPELVRDRLHRAILTKAQVAEIEDQIADLSSKLDAQEGDAKAATENTIRTMQKTIRKLRRKEERRAAEVPLPKFFGDKFKNDTEDITSLEKLQPRDAETKIEEKMESLLLDPDIKSLHFQLKIASGHPGRKIIPTVAKTLDRYCLFPYTTDDKSGIRHKHINVPEGQFNDWLSSYRQAVAVAEADEDEYGY
ncbi:hypothetical protein CPC08DRAFT_820305 [Agrocybe pediades]|nr:hypothetical protein CPC08DRAFT_820305 [Agrocybe pediades]